MTTGRASNKGCLSMILDKYLRMLNWTGRQIRKHKGAVIPIECATILEHRDCSTETCFDFVKKFPKHFNNEAGLEETKAS